MSTSSGIEHQYSAETSPRGFLHHAVRAWSLPGRAWQHAVLFQHFYRRELTGRFQGSVLGPLWVLVHPLFLFLVYFAVFGYGLRRVGSGGGMTFFAVYLFSGIVCFHGLIQGTVAAMSSIVGNSSLVKKVAFPCELLPVVPPAVEATVYLVGLAIAIVAGMATGVARPGPALLAIPVFMAILLTLGTGLGLLLANLNVFLRDTRQLYGILTTPWLFLSPNFWTPKQIFPAPDKLWLESIWGLVNPAYCLLLANRQIIGMDEETIGIRTSLSHNLGVAAAWSLVLFIVGYGTFMTQKHKYADLV